MGYVSFGLFVEAQAYVAFYRKIEALGLGIVVSGAWSVGVWVRV